jgi:hypothetical protein
MLLPPEFMQLAAIAFDVALSAKGEAVMDVCIMELVKQWI